jgi:hypothetical protein
LWMTFILGKANFPKIITSSGIDVCKNDKNYNDCDFCFSSFRRFLRCQTLSDVRVIPPMLTCRIEPTQQRIKVLQENQNSTDTI